MRRRLATSSPSHPPAYYRAMAALLDVEARMARLAAEMGKALGHNELLTSEEVDEYVALAALRDARQREAEAQNGR